MIQLVSLHINTDRQQELAEFYAKVLGVEPAWSEEGVTGFMLGDVLLEIGHHDQVSGENSQPARLFFDLKVDDIQAEFDRIVQLGAGVVQEPYELSLEGMKMTIATLTDLDGNYFQLVSR